ncbi:hypothetical protein HMI48_05450 [Acidithiobacillus ferrooxidans]|uniref:hypothetical protein n=1 Tax=Acidithiobacillus ferrooxidans TaxID=920 RepID=UPI001C068A52|nr:hypothetical protein [Acidithiobacillus ferrooxidans]MBU2773368.1 hypothetical protein [Acidithiobacillus ferrooxidans]
MQANDREQLLSKAIEIFEGMSASDKRADGPLCAIKKAASELRVPLPDDVVNPRTARKSELVQELKYRILAEGTNIRSQELNGNANTKLPDFLHTDTDRPCVLHLYGQEEPNESAYIVANLDGLIRLRDLLTHVIEHGPIGQENFSTADDNGFRLRVSLATESEARCLVLPYTEEGRQIASKRYRIFPDTLFEQNYIEKST